MAHQRPDSFQIFQRFVIFMIAVVGLSYLLSTWFQHDTKGEYVTKNVCREMVVYVPSVTNGTFSFLFEQDENDE